MLPRLVVALVVGFIFFCIVTVEATESQVETKASEEAEGDLDVLDFEEDEDDDESVDARAAGKEVEIGRKKVKLKKKHKKFLKELAMIHFMVKAALLPLVIGGLKLLTGKALLMTMMGLVLVLTLTFSHSPPKHTTEIINLVPNKHKRSLPDEFTMSAIEKVINRR